MKKLLLLCLLIGLPAAAAMVFYNSSNLNLGHQSELKCSTGISCSVVSGKLEMSSSPTLTNPLAMAGAEGVDASLTLQADESDDNGDDWKLSSVASGNAFALANDASGSFVNKVTVAASTGNVTLVGGLIGDGGDSIVGFLNPVVAATATTITIAQCGSMFVNSGAVQMELPEASTAIGCRLAFATGNASNFDVNPDDADQILILTNAAGDAIRNATLGDTVVIQAISASQWVEISAVGSYSDIN